MLGISRAVFVMLFFLSILIQDSTAQETNRRPNVVLVLVDDMGYGDLSCLGGSYLKTPNIDRLHSESVRLTDFHVDPTCAPTRASLFTGKYSAKTGVWHTLAGRSFPDKDEVFLSEIFKENGYRTGLFGKWHMGDNYPYLPQYKGFEEVLTFRGGGVGQIDDFWYNDYFDDIYVHNGKHEFYEGYCTDVWFENATKFIEVNQNTPFFCYISTNAPHYPYNVPNEYTLDLRKLGLDDNTARYLGMVANIDENVGRLIQRLTELSLIDNTVFMFMSDNGRSAVALPKTGQPFFFNAGMRGLKGSSYDGGHRVPFFIKWPNGNIGGGKDVDRLLAGFDLMSTLIELCGLKNDHVIDFDGRSFFSLLKDANSKWPERTLFVQNQRIETPVKWRNCSVMTEQYRLMNGKELFDIKKDPGQKKDIASENAEVVEKLRGAYEKWWQEISFRFDDYNRFYIGDDLENPTHLTLVDWHVDTLYRIWDQSVVRQRNFGNGFWAVNIVRDGVYEFTCRTYPKQEDTRLDVARVRISIGDQDITQDCDPGTSEVKVRIPLKAGDSILKTWFYESDGNSYGVPFVYIERL
ncbi:MAG: arylsulfatase [Chitinophagaceae bacterium]|nr:arylsulfatase [Chitinophagaceae bacterium]